MKFKKVLGLILIICFVFNSFTIVSGEPVPIDVDAKAAVLMEPTTGKILLEKNKDDQLPLASVTKIMTLLLIYDAIDDGKINWDDTVTVSEHAASMGGSQVFLEPNEKQSVRDLVKSISIASANDASVAMAEYIAGTEDAFVTMMNQKAQELGMVNTHFVNACGLDAPNHYSSAYDVALMTQYLTINHPEVFEFSGIWQDSIVHTTTRGSEEFGLTNTNKLIKTYDGATGLKTGSTNDALYCLSGTATKDGSSLIAVILGAPTPNIRFQEVGKMFDYGFTNYTIENGKPDGTVMGSVNVYKGSAEKVDAVIKKQTSLVVEKGNKQKLEEKVDLENYINAPIEKGAKLGEVIYSFGGKEVGRCDLVSNIDVSKASFYTMLGKLLKNWI